MTDNRREQQRVELHRTIWAIANDLRDSVDGWDFKQNKFRNQGAQHIMKKTISLILRAC